MKSIGSLLSFVIILTQWTYSDAVYTLWKVQAHGITISSEPQGSTGYSAPIGTLLVGEAQKELVQIVFPWDGYALASALVPMRLPSCPSTSAGLSPSGRPPALLEHNFTLSNMHFSSLATSGHWTEQAAIGNGYMGMFVGGTLRAALQPLSVTDMFAFTKQQLMQENKPSKADYLGAREAFLKTASFPEGKLNIRDSTGKPAPLCACLRPCTCVPVRLGERAVCGCCGCNEDEVEITRSRPWRSPPFRVHPLLCQSHLCQFYLLLRPIPRCCHVVPTVPPHPQPFALPPHTSSLSSYRHVPRSRGPRPSDLILSYHLQ